MEGTTKEHFAFSHLKQCECILGIISNPRPSSSDVHVPFLHKREVISALCVRVKM